MTAAQTEMNSGKIAAEARGIYKSFGNISILHDVSVAIAHGESRALVGRNGAGKSTLVGMLTGLFAPSRGTILFNDTLAPSLGDREGWRERVACVYQKWMIIPQLTVAENLFLNSHPKGFGGMIAWQRMRDKAMSILRDWNLEVEPDLDAWRLTVEQRQIVEIARALLQGSRFIILDEPTAELERREVNRLFDRILGLQNNGVTFLYISHHLEEIYEVCKAVTVLRDGHVVADAPLSEMPKDKLVAAMVGEVGVKPVSSARQMQSKGSLRLELKDLAIGDLVSGINLNVREGECVGLAGLAGSGKDEIAEVVAGLSRPKSGSVLIDGRPATSGNAETMRQMGVGYVAKDRHVRGIFPLMSVADNLTVTILGKLGDFGFISTVKQKDFVDRQIEKFAIVADSGEQAIGQLSGGNQQKTIVGRALASNPTVLVLVSPTQGVDIASKQSIYEIINRAKQNGMAVLVVSDDLDELNICDRIEIIFRGSLTKAFYKGWKEHEVVAAIEGLY